MTEKIRNSRKGLAEYEDEDTYQITDIDYSKENDDEEGV